jgi:hypothetical protein
MADVPRRACYGTLAVIVLMVFALAGPGFGSPQAPQPVPTDAPRIVPAVPVPTLQPQPQQPTPNFIAAGPGGLRFQFKIDPNTPLNDLLPVPPKVRRLAGPVLTDDLAQVPEILFQEPLARKLGSQKALQQTAHLIAKINHLNQKKTDAFIEALLQKRADLAGLPFAMGDACRTKGERSRQFNAAVSTVRRVLAQTQGGPGATAFAPVSEVRKVTFAGGGLKGQPAPPPEPPPPPVDPSGPGAPAPATLATSGPPGAATSAAKPPPVAPTLPPGPGPLPPGGGPPVQVIREFVQVAVPAQQAPPGAGPVDAADSFWQQYQDTCAQEDRNDPRRDCGHQENVTLARVAALMQILAPETPGLRLGLVKYLASVSHVEATRALARLALFAAEDEVRRAAIDALKVRRERDYTDILLQGFRYPLPAVARRAGEAVVKLERTDLAPQLVAILDEPDPRAPVRKEVHEKKVPVVRDLVRVNHHRSCLLCHAPGNTPAVSPEAVTAPVPVPSDPLPAPSQGYGNSIPDVFVRVDVTYLRQDFSLLLPVADANPWPEMQRFDFLVRSRVLTEEEAKAFEEKLLPQEPGYVPPHRRAALAALRELTGRDTEPTAQAWRRLLSLPAPPRRAESTH